MTTFDYVLQILLLVFGVVLVISVLLQKSKAQGLSGTIAGGQDTYYGKSAGSKKEKILSIITIVAGIAFVVLAIIVYCKQIAPGSSSLAGNAWESLKDIVGDVPTTPAA